MNDENKTKEQLLTELGQMRRQLAQLEALETRRQQREDIIQELVARLTTLIENLQMGVLVEDETRRINYVNQPFCDLFGIQVSPPLFIGIDCTQASLAASKIFANPEGFIQGIATRLANQKPVIGEILAMADGRIVERDYIPITTNKAHHGHLWLYRDITERKRAETTLRESEARYHILFEQALDAIHVENEANEIVDVNYRACQLFGYSREELLTMRLYDLQAPEKRSRPNNIVQEEIACYGNAPFETVDIHRDGTRIPVEVSVSKITSSQGNLYISIVRDITERKWAEATLRESEAKFRAIANFTIDWETWFGQDGTLLWVNPAVEKITGYSVPECLVMPDYPAPIIAEEDRDLISVTGLSTRYGHRGDDVEFRFHRKDGAERWGSVSWQPILNAEGNSMGHRVSIRDITERKRTEMALIQEQSFLETLLDSLPGIFYLYDFPALRLVRWNHNYETKTGFTAEEMQNRHIWEWHQEEMKEFVLQAAQKAMEKGQNTFEAPLHTKDGRYISFLLTGIRFDTPEQSYLMGIGLNITERKRAEGILYALNRAALTLAQAMTPAEIFAAVADELKQLGFSCALFPTDESRSRLLTTYMSYDSTTIHAIERLIGFSQQDFSIPIEKVDRLKEIVWEKKTIFNHNLEELFRQILPQPAQNMADQMAQILQNSPFIGTPLLVQDQVIGVLMVQSNDLTQTDIPAITALGHQVAAAWRKVQLLQDQENNLAELNRTQAQLIQAQKMEAIGRLAGGVAHDFNNLLTAIIGYASLLRMRFTPDNPLRQDVEEITKCADRAAALTGQLLAFSRKQILQPRVLSLNTIVTHIEKMLHRLIGEDIELTTLLEPHLGYVEVDPTQIEQVIMNLAVNARDAMPQGGKLTLETKNIYLDEEYSRQHLEVLPGPYVMLAISDTGTGMSPETLAHLFEPFFTTKEVGKGTGLGLATIFGIIKQSGGNIGVYSEVGQGSTFKIYLPRVSEAVEAAGHTPASIEFPHGHETILLVEDAAPVRELMRRTLSYSGYTVLEGQNGLDALQVYQEHAGTIHLLVTDVVMPGMSGRELADRLVNLQPEVKVLYISGYTDDAIVHHGVLNPDVAFLPKPFTPEELTRKVRTVLDGD